MTSREDGFTLIEVALTLVILSIVSLYFLSYFTNGTTQSKLTNQRLSAIHLANAKLHETQAMDFDDLQESATCMQQSLPDVTKDMYLLKTEICSTHAKYTSNPDVLYITITTYWAPDPEQNSKYKHQVSITGAVKRQYPSALSGGSSS